MNVIVVGRNGWLDQQESLEGHLRAHAYGFFRRWWNGATYFHRDGHTYTVSSVRPPRQLGILDRILASTVYNPTLDFAVEYERGAAYSLGQLRDAVSVAIQQDDDVLTQFHERDELLTRLNAATS